MYVRLENCFRIAYFAEIIMTEKLKICSKKKLRINVLVLSLRYNRENIY